MTKMEQTSKLVRQAIDQIESRVMGEIMGEPAAAEPDAEFPRIRRIGKRLFGVANCVVALIGSSSNASSVDGKRSMESIVAGFCEGIAPSEHPTVVTDARSDLVFANHRNVVGAPYIRFFASHPVFSDGALMGSVCLVDYNARNFGEDDKQLLADLAVLVERELKVSSLNSAQLELQRKNRNLRRDSLVDPVLGTWNRAAITRVLGTEAERCRKEGVPLSMVFADIDSVKEFRDVHGHQVGDALLLKAASRLRSCIRPSDALGRFDGEKFLIVLPGAAHAIAKVVAERMRHAIISQPELAGGAIANLSLSTGTVSTDKFPLASVDELIEHADSALRAAKNAGVNRIVQALPPTID